jgi:p70 ribosomal S6 kinase
MVQHRGNEDVYAMKVVKKDLLLRKNHVRYMKAERNILTKVNHPFIVGLKFAFHSAENVFLILDFCHGGELFSLLRKEGLLLEETARFYIIEIILALEHLHNLNIIHRDLKPENVLLDSDGHVKLTDFGLAKEISRDSDRTKTICGK